MMNYQLRIKKSVILFLILLSCAYFTKAQDVNVDVNLNIKHSVNGVSKFEREKYMTLHGTSFETDWDGEEDKLDYLLNKLDTYFGRDTGSATWKFSATEEDPNRPNRPSLEHMNELGTWLKGEYEKDYLTHQYEKKSRELIGGTNPHPTYPTLSWNGDGVTWTGWQPMDVDVSAEWVVNYLDMFFRKSEGGQGEPLPGYWEVINEPDMPMMTGHMTCTSQEKIWEYHNLVAQGVKERFGADNPYRPKIGGMTWGLHDFHLPDGISRYDENYLDQWLDGDGYITYHNMMDSEANNYRSNPWYQWDIMWQGFMDTCGPNMDFYSIHIYDWPGWNLNANDAPSATRSGGHTEAMLDIIEWYDLYKTGTRKELIVSEFGAVNGQYNDNNRPGVYDQQRMDWENLKPFNAMFMQFLERPDYITKSMPFTPIKAIWGDIPDQDLRYPYAMMRDEDGDGEWEWSEYIKFFQLWSNVKGTRIDTKSTNRDLQVDAYVDGNKIYLILNNLENTPKDVNLSFYDDYENPVQSVLVKNLYLDMNKGQFGKPALDEFTVESAPGAVTLDSDATMVLEYTFANSVTLDQTSDETKFMGEKIGSGYHEFGSELIHTTSQSLSTSVNGVVVPNGEYEATLRISGAFFKAHLGSVVVKINGVELEHNSNWRGSLGDLRNQWLGTLEVDIPAGLLQASNTIECQTNAPTDWATTQIQVWDFSKAPGRSGSNAVALNAVSIEGDTEVMQGQKEALKAVLSPANATNKALVWTSSNTSVATVDEYGVVTGVASSGSATITATNTDRTISSTFVISAIPYADTPVANLSIEEGNNVEVDFYVTTPLTLNILPLDATNQEAVWSSSNDLAVQVDPQSGSVTGVAIGESAVITATINDNGNVITASTIVNVGIVGDEKVYCDAMISEVTGNTEYTFDVFVNLLGTRTIKVELMKGNTVLGTGTTTTEVKGKDVVAVDLSLNAVPPVGNYALRVSALEGNQIIDQCSSDLSILDRIRPESITLVDWLREVEVGQTLPVTAEVLPANAFDKTVLWTSSNPGVATVDNNGTVTGLSLGNTVIRGTLQDGGLYAEANVTVKSQVVVQPTQIIIPTDITVFPGGNMQVTPVYVPEWTTEKSITWSTNNPALATVDANGLISASTTEGTLTLTATSASNQSVVATSNLTVGTTLVIQAESFSNMGGAVGDIAIYDIPTGGQGINNVQAGDFVEYEVFVPQAGEYSIAFFAGTAVEDGVIEMFVNSESQGSAKVPMNDWDAYATVALGQRVNLPQGNVTIGLVGAGTSDWQWNLDYFQMNFEGEITCNETLESINITASATTIKETETATLTASLLPTDVCPKVISWSSNNTNIATVNNNGVVTGTGVGTATISATADGITSTIDIVVESNYVAVTGVTLDPSEVSLFVNNSAQLTATVYPTNASNKNVTWTSSNPSVATVSNGQVTAVTEGSAVITVTTVGETFTATTNVTVQEVGVEVPVTGVTVDKENVTLDVNQSTTINAIIAPLDATNTNLTWSSTNTAIASVNNGIVTGLAEGTTTVTVTTVDGGFAAKTVVTVNGIDVGSDIVIEAEDFVATGGTFNDAFVPLGVNKVDNLGINYVNGEDWAEYTVSGNGTYEITYHISTPMSGAAIEAVLDGTSVGVDNVPSNGQWDDYQPLKSAHQIVLNGSHTLRLVGAGTNVWQWNLDKVVLTPVASQVIPVTGINVTPSNASLLIGETTQLSASVLPANATDASYTWSSSNSAVATINNGLVTAISEGSATITATTNDGGFTATTTISVTDVVTPPSGLVIEAEDFTSTGGTYNDGHVPLGVNRVSGLGINWVNSGDWAEYTMNIEGAGEYEMEYAISTPTSGDVAIQIEIDGNVVSTDAVPNNGQWDDYQPLSATGTVTLAEGIHTVRIIASGSAVWQWNLDKVTFTPVSSSARKVESKVDLAEELSLYPNPSTNVVNIKGLPNGAYQVALYNINGVLVDYKAIDFKYIHQLNVEDLSSGIYLMRIVGEGVEKNVRISVVK
ncbi:Ig-like domain-containing protein [Flammeovirga sp. EKP202]|uniref:Ig-like domain-containing protein n=1 Tax=Flammeovirga sp. EKP202 TaxID=2770592 RepID=UPI00165FEF33|nr:Ig-like domain-containing protein [Flammeovirga sp. EKP202]MBD0401358.1 Ig-like domain-containing protein [Flammeovirga sp. EKP202]